MTFDELIAKQLILAYKQLSSISAVLLCVPIPCMHIAEEFLNRNTRG
jgi:hypothetical protein